MHYGQLENSEYGNRFSAKLSSNLVRCRFRNVVSLKMNYFAVISSRMATDCRSALQVDCKEATLK